MESRVWIPFVHCREQPQGLRDPLPETGALRCVDLCRRFQSGAVVRCRREYFTAMNALRAAGPDAASCVMHEDRRRRSHWMAGTGRIDSPERLDFVEALRSLRNSRGNKSRTVCASPAAGSDRQRRLVIKRRRVRCAPRPFVDGQTAAVRRSPWGRDAWCDYETERRRQRAWAAPAVFETTFAAVEARRNRRNRKARITSCLRACAACMPGARR